MSPSAETRGALDVADVVDGLEALEQRVDLGAGQRDAVGVVDDDLRGGAAAAGTCARSWSMPTWARAFGAS